MTTPAQIQANRLNAQKSTGPRTPEGKAATSQNALKHGLWAQNPVIQGEDPGEFETYRDRMLAELAPEGPLESTLADRVVGLTWRLKRAEHLQAQVFDALLAPDTSPLAKLARSLSPRHLQPPDDPATDDLALGRAVLKDFAGARVLDRLGMVERRLEHSLYKTLAELQRLRLLRQIDPPLDPAEPQGHVQSRKTNPIAAGVLSPVERISPPENTENPARRHSKPDDRRSALTSPARFAIISPSAKAEKASQTVPSPADPFAIGPLGRKRTRSSPGTGPRQGRGLQLEGLRRP